MSDPSRQRLIRAVRLLPGIVRVGHGTMENIDPPEELTVLQVEENARQKEQSALVAAEAEIRKLKSELRDKETELNETKASLQGLRSQIDAIKADLERERKALREQAALEAKEQRESAAKTGYDEGHEKGHTEGLLAAEREIRAEYEGKFSDVLALLSGVNEALGDSREKLAEAHVPQLIRLWEMMLQRMLQVDVDLDPDVVQRLLQYILKRVSDREKIIVYLNPADIAMIEGIKDRLMDSIRGVKFFELLSDDHVNRGSCLIETNLGIYDGRWRTQLEQISTEVQNLLMESMAKDGTDNDTDGTGTDDIS